MAARKGKWKRERKRKCSAQRYEMAAVRMDSKMLFEIPIITRDSRQSLIVLE